MLIFTKEKRNLIKLFRVFSLFIKIMDKNLMGGNLQHNYNIKLNHFHINAIATSHVLFENYLKFHIFSIIFKWRHSFFNGFLIKIVQKLFEN